MNTRNKQATCRGTCVPKKFSSIVTEILGSASYRYQRRYTDAPLSHRVAKLMDACLPWRISTRSTSSHRQCPLEAIQLVLLSALHGGWCGMAHTQTTGTFFHAFQNSPLTMSLHTGDLGANAKRRRKWLPCLILCLVVDISHLLFGVSSLLRPATGSPLFGCATRRLDTASRCLRRGIC